MQFRTSTKYSSENRSIYIEMDIMLTVLRATVARSQEAQGYPKDKDKRLIIVNPNIFNK